MEKMIEIIRAIEGIDETGNTKAICNIGILRGSNEDDLEVVKSYNTMDAVVSICTTETWAIVDLCFEDSFDYDLVQITQLCTEYEHLTKSKVCKDGQMLSLVVSLALAGDYETFVIGRNGFWGLIPQEVGGVLSTIRFVFSMHDFGVYEFSEQAVELLIEETIQEIEVSLLEGRDA